MSRRVPVPTYFLKSYLYKLIKQGINFTRHIFSCENQKFLHFWKQRSIRFAANLIVASAQNYLPIFPAALSKNPPRRFEIQTVLFNIPRT